MPIVRQLRESYPWIADSLAAIVAGATGIAALLPLAPLAPGALSAPREHSWEHPLRGSILRTLERSPGIHYRELQRQLSVATGTLRHHLRALVNERSVTIVPVNGRTCYYAGAPAQVEILEGTGVTDQATAAAMLPVGLSGVQRNIVTILSNSSRPPSSQAQLAREMGKSRTTVNSAIGILRKRGIVNQGTLSLAPHLDCLGLSKVEYPWLEIRKELA
jgi:DNA-binding MarR family transcriptional regulator